MSQIDTSKYVTSRQRVCVLYFLGSQTTILLCDPCCSPRLLLCSFMTKIPHLIGCSRYYLILVRHNATNGGFVSMQHKEAFFVVHVPNLLEVTQKRDEEGGGGDETGTKISGRFGWSLCIGLISLRCRARLIPCSGCTWAELNKHGAAALVPILLACQILLFG